MIIRPACGADLPVLRALYANAVRAAGPASYTLAQVAAWAAFANDHAFAGFIDAVHTYVALADHDTDAHADADSGSGSHGPRILGFCGVGDDGHVASVYVDAAFQGQGIGTALLDFALAAHPAPTTGRYRAEASAFSLPLFLRLGFRLVGTERVLRDAVPFERFLVEKAVGKSESSAECRRDRSRDGS